MPLEQVLPDDINRIIWRYVYSSNVVVNIPSHANKINPTFDYEPTGTFNYTRIFSTNYNFLRIISGMGGLNYSS